MYSFLWWYKLNNNLHKIGHKMLTCEEDLGLRFREVHHTQEIHRTQTALTPPTRGARGVGVDKEGGEKKGEIGEDRIRISIK